MRKLAISTLAAVAVTLSGISVSFAQDDGPPNFTPVEMSACTYKDRQDRDDLDSANARMIRWMEDNNSEPYAGWILEKLFTRSGSRVRLPLHWCVAKRLDDGQRHHRVQGDCPAPQLRRPRKWLIARPTCCTRA